MALEIEYLKFYLFNKFSKSHFNLYHKKKNNMQIIGLILLIATSWYIFKLTSNFLDDQTKKELDENFELFKKQFKDLKNRFSKDNLKLIWEKYKEERKTSTTKDD